MTHNSAPTTVPIHELIAGRWSPRAYSGAPVSRDALHTVLEAARWAPSAYNLQPWRFLVFDKTKDEAAFKRAFATLVPFNQQWNAPAQVLIAVTAQTLNAKGEKNHTAQYDTGAAALALVLQAHALGLAAHQMSGIDKHAFRAEFSVPDDVDVLSIISIAHYGDAEKLEPALRDREKAARTRAPVATIAYEGAWEKPFTA